MRCSARAFELTLAWLLSAALVGCADSRPLDSAAGTGQSEDPPVDTSPSAESDDRSAPAQAPASQEESKPAANPPATVDDDDLEPPPGAGNALPRLSSEEAPEASQTFFWGTPQITAPGFAVVRNDTLTIALDHDNRLRYLAFGRFSSVPKTFGDDAGTFPLNGSRHVDLSDSLFSYDATVDPASFASPDRFLFRMRMFMDAPLTDLVESIEGTRVENGWAIVYSERGKLWAAEIDAHAEATLYAGDARAGSPTSGASAWSAPVELVAPDFYGPPVDHLNVQLDAEGQLHSFGFDHFVRKQTFGTGSADFPLSGTAQRDTATVTVDEAIAPTLQHFVTRYHVYDPPKQSDYVEGLEGTREGGTLSVRYFIQGKLWGATIDAHAAGVLVPIWYD